LPGQAINFSSVQGYESVAAAKLFLRNNGCAIGGWKLSQQWCHNIQPELAAQ
jgi:hypothetical protein